MNEAFVYKVSRIVPVESSVSQDGGIVEKSGYSREIVTEDEVDKRQATQKTAIQAFWFQIYYSCVARVTAGKDAILFTQLQYT